jgi:hypothetical protein
LEIPVHGAAELSNESDETWNKWRGPALRGERAVYAAKARRLSIDSENDVIKSNTQGKPSLFFQERVRALPPPPGGRNSGFRVFWLRRGKSGRV